MLGSSSIWTWKYLLLFLDASAVEKIKTNIRNSTRPRTLIVTWQSHSGEIRKWKITRSTVVPWFANFPTPIVCFAIFFTFSLTHLAIVSQLLRQFSRFCTDLRIFNFLFQRLWLKKEENIFLGVCIDGKGSRQNYDFTSSYLILN